MFLLGKIKKLYNPTDVFLRIFSDFSEQPFFRLTASVERKKFQKHLSGYVFKNSPSEIFEKITGKL